MEVMQEKTFVMVKPDGVVKGLVGEVISRLEQRGLKVVAIKMFTPTVAQIDSHYPKDDGWISGLGTNTKATYEKYGHDVFDHLKTRDELAIGKIVRGWILTTMTAGPVVTLVFEGLHAVDMVRKVVGSTVPATAPVGTIRGDFSIDSPLLANLQQRSLLNLVHASGTVDEAEREIAHWFKPNEIVSYDRGEPTLVFANPKSKK